MLFTKKYFLNFGAVFLFLLANLSFAYAEAPTFILTPDVHDISIGEGGTMTVHYTIYNNSPQNFTQETPVSVFDTYPTAIAEAVVVLGGTSPCPSLHFPLASKASCTLGFQVTGKSIGAYTLAPKVCEYSGQRCSRPEEGNEINVDVVGNWMRVGAIGPDGGVIQDLINFNDQVYAATPTGAFVFSSGNWIAASTFNQLGNTTSFTQMTGELYAGTRPGGVFFLTSSGWTPRGAPGTPGTGNISSLAIQEGILWAGTSDTLPSTGYSLWNFVVGDGWGATVPCLVHNGVSSLFGSINTALYMGTNNVGVYHFDDVNCPRMGTSGPGTTAVSSLLLADGGTVYAGVVNGGVYTYNAVSETWSSKGNGIQTCTVNDLIEVAGTFYAAVNGGAGCLGVFELVGDNWELVSSVVPGGTGALSLLAIGNTLYAGTNGAGVWSIEVPGT